MNDVEPPEWLLTLWGGFGDLEFADSVTDDDDSFSLVWRDGAMYIQFEKWLGTTQIVGSRLLIAEPTQALVIDLMKACGFGIPTDVPICPLCER